VSRQTLRLSGSVQFMGVHECRTVRDSSVPGYRVCRHGFVWGRTGRVLKCPVQRGRHGFTVPLPGGRFRRVQVATVVCEAFYGPRPTGRHHAAHRNGNPLDNRASNLYWATPEQNEADKVKHGTRAWCERHGMHVLTDADVRYIRSVWVPGKRGLRSALASRFGVTPEAVYMAATGRSWAGLDV
jgi:hypothetical protein